MCSVCIIWLSSGLRLWGISACVWVCLSVCTDDWFLVSWALYSMCVCMLYHAFAYLWFYLWDSLWHNYVGMHYTHLCTVWWHVYVKECVQRMCIRAGCVFEYTGPRQLLDATCGRALPPSGLLWLQIVPMGLQGIGQRRPGTGWMICLALLTLWIIDLSQISPAYVNFFLVFTPTMYIRHVQTIPQRASVAAGFYSNQSRANSDQSTFWRPRSVD